MKKREIDYTEGRLFLHNKQWFLDAEPHVLVLFERLFPRCEILKTYWIDDKELKMEFTQRPRVVSDTIENKKELQWFIGRYQITISKHNLELINNGAVQYNKNIEDAKKSFFEYKPVPLKLALPLRNYQEQAVSLALNRKSLLVADQVGLGKTPIAIAIATKHLPAVCVVPPHLVTQWQYEIKKFYPDAKIYRINQWSKINSLPSADFYIDTYTKVWKGTDKLLKLKFRTLILDEVHSLRHDGTKKYNGVSLLAENSEYKIGLSATPVMNYGNELFNIFCILKDGILGDRYEFYREWCNSWGRIENPELLGNYLRKNFLMIRRTRKDVDRELNEVNRIVYNVDADLEALKKFESDGKLLAMKIITGDFKEAGDSSREFDYLLRQATGVAKAKAVAEVVKMVVESGEKVVLFGWHREVYSIWLDELEELNPVMFTGSESVKQKEESLKKFIEDKDTKIFIMSLRSGAGINGLQHVSCYAIFGELDWSAGVIDQCIGRLWREGQEQKVTAMFVTIEDGSDPIMKRVIGNKAIEAKKIISSEAEILYSANDNQQILHLAKEWLKMKGVDVESILKKKEQEASGELFIDAPIEGMAGFGLWNLLRKQFLNANDELELQEQIGRILTENKITFKREFILSDKSRVDFKVGSILIECKAGKFNKREMLAQIKRYQKECSELDAIVIVTPNLMRHFKIRETPIYVINTGDSNLMVEGLS